MLETKIYLTSEINEEDLLDFISAWFDGEEDDLFIDEYNILSIYFDPYAENDYFAQLTLQTSEDEETHPALIALDFIINLSFWCVENRVSMSWTDVYSGEEYDEKTGHTKFIWNASEDA